MTIHRGGRDAAPARTPGRWRGLAVILLASLALKLLLLWPAARLSPQGDEIAYLGGARSLVATGTLRYPFRAWDEAHAAPFMPYYLAACRALFGPDRFRLVARIGLILLSTLTVAFVYGLARRLCPARALLAAAVTAFYPPLVAFSHYFYSETPYIFFLTGSALLLLAGGRAQGGRALAAGLLGGGAALTRSVFVAQVPLIVAWILLGDAAWRRRWSTALLFVAGVGLVVLPWSVHNTRRYGRFLLIDTNMGNVLFKNLNSRPAENYDIGVGRRYKELWRAQEPFPPGRRRVALENPVERNRAETRAALGYIANHPGSYLRACGRRLLEFFNPTSFLVRELRRPGQYGDPPAWLVEPIVIASMTATAALLLLGAFGVARASPTGPEALAVGLILGHLAVSVLVISMSRYRLPVMPLLIPLALAVPDGWRWRQSIGRWVVALGLVAVMVISWVRFVPFSFPEKGGASGFERQGRRRARGEGSQPQGGAGRRQRRRPAADVPHPGP